MNHERVRYARWTGLSALGIALCLMSCASETETGDLNAFPAELEGATEPAADGGWRRRRSSTTTTTTDPHAMHGGAAGSAAPTQGSASAPDPHAMHGGAAPAMGPYIDRSAL